MKLAKSCLAVASIAHLFAIELCRTFVLIKIFQGAKQSTQAWQSPFLGGR